MCTTWQVTTGAARPAVDHRDGPSKTDHKAVSNIGDRLTGTVAIADG